MWQSSGVKYSAAASKCLTRAFMPELEPFPSRDDRHRRRHAEDEQEDRQFLRKRITRSRYADPHVARRYDEPDDAEHDRGRAHRLGDGAGKQPGAAEAQTEKHQ